MYENEKVDEDDAKKLASDLNAIFQKTSAKESTGVEDLFVKIGKKFLNPNSDEGGAKNEQRNDKSKSIKLNKKKGNEDRERIFSEDTNDATYENKNIKNENEEDKLSNCELTNEIYNLINDEDDNINHIEINLKKRERFVSI